MKPNTWQIESMDRQFMIDKIYEVVKPYTWWNTWTDEDLVMIWDVLEYIYSDSYKNYISTYNDKDDLIYFNWWVGAHVMTLMKLWHSLNKSIGIQNMDCIQYVYELTLLSE